MAISANTVWECRASGTGVSDNNGGGYAPITVSTFSGTDLVVDASLNTKVTSATHNFVLADAGTRIYVTAGTGWTPGFYTILSTGSNAATLNASPAPTSTTGGTWAEVGADYSQQGAPQVAIDDATPGPVTVSITANVITFTGYTPTNADVGNLVQILQGTNCTAGWYQITATTSSTWTVTGAANLPTSGTTDTSSGTKPTGNMGGALLTLNTLATAMLASNTAWATGAFTTTAQITFAQTTGGLPTSTLAYTKLLGYGSVRRDSGHATLTLTSGTPTIVLSSTGQGFMVSQVDVDCSQINTIGIKLAGIEGVVRNCKVSNYGSAGILGAANPVLIEGCELTGTCASNSIGISVTPLLSKIIGNCIHDVTGATTHGIQIGSGVLACVVERNLICNVGTSGVGDGIRVGGGATTVIGNTIYNLKGAGISITVDDAALFGVWNNLIVSCVVGGLTCVNSIPAAPEYDGNAYYNNGAGGVVNRTNVGAVTGIFGVNPYTNVNDVILTQNPFINATTGATANLGLNRTAGGGLACQGSGVPGTFPGITGTTAYPDMGAVQHKIPKRIEIIH